MAKKGYIIKEWRENPRICAICDKPLTYKQHLTFNQTCGNVCGKKYRSYIKAIKEGVFLIK